MYKRIKAKKLGRKRSHRVSLIKNQLRSLFTNGYLSTTTTKAKVLKANAQQLLNKAEGDIMNLDLQRDLSMILGERELVDALVDYTKKNKSAVRVMKVSYRDGDNAQLSKVELVGYTPVKKAPKGKKKVKKKVEGKKQPEPKQKDGIGKAEQPKSLGKKVKERITGSRQQRATSRSGLQ